MSSLSSSPTQPPTPRPLTPPPTSTPTTCSNLKKYIQNLSPLFTPPVLLLILVAALDNADSKLLSSSFPMLERTLHLSISTLGLFSLFTNLSYAIALPFWGILIHKYGISKSHILLSQSCLFWGCATLGIAWSGSSIIGQALFRSLNGFSLASILPLSQAMLLEFIPTDMRGRGFGLMLFVEQIAGSCAGASAIYFENWKGPYLVLGVFSVLVSVLVRITLKIHREDDDDDDDEKEEVDVVGQDEEENGHEVFVEDMRENNHRKKKKKMSVIQIMSRIARIPTFILLVGQGIFGAVPWGMMSFLLLLWEWRGFTKQQMVLLQVFQSAGFTIGSALGGFLGDHFVLKHPQNGRMYVALVSVGGGIPLYGLSLFSKEFMPSLVWMTLFSLCSTWTSAGANRPICAELARNVSERAQIVALWIMLEKLSSALFGAPLVGYFTKVMLDNGDEDVGEDTMAMSKKADALAYNLFGLSSFFWIPCAFQWFLMSRVALSGHFNKERIPDSDPMDEGETIELNAVKGESASKPCQQLS